MDAITFDVTAHLNKFNKIGSSSDFIISKSMNDTAFLDARDQLSKQMKKDLFIRNKGMTSKFMFKIEKSNKKDLQVNIQHKVKGLGLQQRGGTETATSKRLSIPNRKAMSKHFGISVSKNIPKKLKISEIYKKAPKTKQEGAYIYKGKSIFIQENSVFVDNKGIIEAIYQFVKKATHNKKQFKMQGSVEQSFNRRFTKRFNINYLKLLKG